MFVTTTSWCALDVHQMQFPLVHCYSALDHTSNNSLSGLIMLILVM